MTGKDYEPDKVKDMAEHPPDEGCSAQDHDHKAIGLKVPVYTLWNWLTGKVKLWD